MGIFKVGFVDRNLLIEFPNECVICLLLHVQLNLLIPLLVFNLLLQVGNPLIGGVKLVLFNQDLFREFDLWLTLLISFGYLIVVSHAKAGQDTIQTN